MSVTPTLPDLNAPPADDAVADPVGKETIANITKIGGGFLVTFTDGREVELHLGDSITLGPITRDTTVDLGDGEGPVNLRDLHHQGALPADLHGMIPPQPTPTAAEAGLAIPQLADLPQGAASAPVDAEDLQDGGADEAQEGEAPLPKPMLKGM